MPSAVAGRRRVTPLAGLAAAALIVALAASACTGPAGSARVTVAGSGTSSPAPAPSPTTPTATPAPATTPPSRSTPAHTATTTHTHPPATSHPKPDATPRVVRVAITPDDMYVCAPTLPFSRPVVTAKVTDPDDPATALRVTLSYDLSATYQGNVRMRYDAGRGLFVYTLPVVDTHAGLDPNGGHLGVSLLVSDPSGAEPRPQIDAVATVNVCGPTIGNG